jgi:hypothetical protein
MDHIRTPEIFSETMSTAFNISEKNRVFKRIRDADVANHTSSRHFQVASWDPCYDLESTNFLRGSDFKTASKTGSINTKDNTIKFVTNGGLVLPNVQPSSSYQNASISPYPCEKTNINKLFQECTSAKSRLGLSQL